MEQDEIGNMLPIFGKGVPDTELYLKRASTGQKQPKNEWSDTVHTFMKWYGVEKEPFPKWAGRLRKFSKEPRKIFDHMKACEEWGKLKGVKPQKAFNTIAGLKKK